jgi:hypothetical protein
MSWDQRFFDPIEVPSGGAAPLCYPSDVTTAMIESYSCYQSSRYFAITEQGQIVRGGKLGPGNGTR